MTLSVSIGVALGATVLNSLLTTTGAPLNDAPSFQPARTLYFGDVDGDALQDVLAIDRQGQARLLLNFGSGRYEDITEVSGLSEISGATCALFEDLDGDGLADLYLGSSEVRTWRNRGDGTFQPVEGGVDHDLVDLAATTLDVDQDGRLDLRVLTERGDLVYRNAGEGRFERIELPSLFDGLLVPGGGAFDPGTVLAPEELAGSGTPVAVRSAAARVRLERWSRNLTLGTPPPGGGVSVPNAAALGNELFCTQLIEDAATGLCIPASSVPAEGSLLPLGDHLSFNDGNNGEAIFGLPGIPGDVRITTPAGFPGISAQTNDLSSFHAVQFFDDRIAINPDGGLEELVVQDDGFVGIGTNDPQRVLHVRDLTDGLIRVDRAADFPAVEFNRYPDLDFGSAPLQTWQVGSSSSGFVISDRIAVEDRLTIDSSGLVSVKESLEIRGGADIVEGFDSSCGALEPGSVVVIDPQNPGQLTCSAEPYDTKVAGVVSGAGGVAAGIKLGQDGVLDGDVPVAMTGRVYVRCSAENGPIQPGDRLTTASLSGHAMRVDDETRSIGAVIGKAMSALDEGTGLVLVLVNLQ